MLVSVDDGCVHGRVARSNSQLPAMQLASSMCKSTATNIYYLGRPYSALFSNAICTKKPLQKPQQNLLSNKLLAAIA